MYAFIIVLLYIPLRSFFKAPGRSGLDGFEPDLIITSVGEYMYHYDMALRVCNKALCRPILDITGSL